MIKLLLQFEIQKISKYFRTKTLAKTITTLLFFAIFLFVGIGIYHFFVSGFRYVHTETTDDIRMALSLFLYEVFLLVLGGIIIASSLVSGIFNLFKGVSNEWILGSPKYKFFPSIIFMRVFLVSLLPSIMMFLPAMLALGKVYSAVNFVGLFFIIISVIAFLITLNAITLLYIICIGYIYYKISALYKRIQFRLGGLIFLIISSIIIITRELWQRVSSVDLVELFRADRDGDILTMSKIGEHFDILPTHPFAMELASWQNGQTKEAIIYFIFLLCIAFISILIWKYLSPLFYPLWQKLQEGNSRSNYFTKRIDTTFSFSGGITTVLFKKELLVSSRNFKAILWFLFLLLIWLLQIAANVLLDYNIRRHQPDLSQKIAILQAIQFIIAIYFISSFTLRFVFPSFSVERKTSWILGSAPLSFKKIFFGKYIFYTTFFIAIGVLMNYINTIVLNVPFTHGAYTMALLVSNIILIVSFGLSLGALYPNTETDDPEVISTSIPGLFFTAVSLIYGAISTFILRDALGTQHFFLLSFFMIITYILTISIVLFTLHKKSTMQLK
jgi:hypothetical protein